MNNNNKKIYLDLKRKLVQIIDYTATSGYDYGIPVAANLAAECIKLVDELYENSI